MIYAVDLAVEDYRNFEYRRLELSRGTTILVGRNAVGKTNLVEALQILTAGQSFRRPSPTELVRDGAARGRAALRLEGEGRRVDMELEVEEGKRRFRRNGKACLARGVRGVLPSVLFCPDDLDMVKRSASVRRRALDDFGSQLNEQYARLAAAYERTVEQRNALLKEAACDPVTMGAWNESFAAAAAALTLHRRALLRRISARFEEVYRRIAPSEEATVSYESSVGALTENEGREGLAGRILARLEELAAEERRRGLTLVGPHRDEVTFSIDGRPARAYGSQGQQRSVVLAWKMAEVEVTRDIAGHPPLLLLDDVMSELDEHRRERLMEFVEGEIQTVVTTTNLGYFSDEKVRSSYVVEVGA